MKQEDPGWGPHLVEWLRQGSSWAVRVECGWLNREVKSVSKIEHFFLRCRNTGNRFSLTGVDRSGCEHFPRVL